MRTLQLFYPYLDQKQTGHKIAIRDKNQIKHLKVLRAGNRDYNFVLADGNFRKATANLLKLTREGAQFEITEYEDRNPALPGQEVQRLFPEIMLPVIRPQKLEQAIDMLTQFNLFGKITLYFSDFTRRSETKFSPRKLERLEKKAESAFLQSQSWLLPKIELDLSGLATTLEAYVSPEHEKSRYWIIPSTEIESSTDEPIVDTNFSEVKFEDSIPTIVIGPEGGFSAKELELFTNLDSDSRKFIRLGDSIFTTETAAVVFASMLKEHY